MEVNRHREPWTQAHGTQGNPVHEQSQALLLNPMRRERSNDLLRLSPDVLLKIMVQYLTLSDTALFMLSCRHVQHLVDNHYPWKNLYQAQLHKHQYLHDPFACLIQNLAQNPIESLFVYKRLYRCLTQGCTLWKVKSSWDHPNYDQIEILSSGNIALMDGQGGVSIFTPTCEYINKLCDHYNQCGCGVGYEFTTVVPLADKGHIVTLDSDYTECSKVRIWSARGEQIINFFTDSISYIAGLSNGNFVAVSSKVMIYSSTGEEIAASKSFSGSRLITCSMVLPNGNIVTGSKNQVIVWSCKDKVLVAVAVKTLNVPMVCMEVLLNGNIVIGDTDKVIIWSPRGIPIHECVVPNQGYHDIRKIVVLTNGNFLIADLNSVYIFLPDGYFLAAIKGNINFKTLIASLPDGGFAITSVGYVTIGSPIGRRIAILEHGGHDAIDCVKVFQNGDILTRSLDGIVRIWTVDVESLMSTRNSDKSSCFPGCSVS